MKVLKGYVSKMSKTIWINTDKWMFYKKYSNWVFAEVALVPAHVKPYKPTQQDIDEIKVKIAKGLLS